MDLSHERVSESRGHYGELDSAQLPPRAAGHGKPLFSGKIPGILLSSETIGSCFPLATTRRG